MPNLIKQFQLQLDELPDTIIFQQTMDLIDLLYTYEPCEFTNGDGETKIINTAGSNEGSCRLFYFAQLNEFTQQQTLSAFGQFYRDDVVANPNGNDHTNIRNFMKTGWSGIQFMGKALTEKPLK